MSKKKRIALWTAIMLCLAGSLYCITAFTECPGLSTLRNLWIETAMTTGEHQWLATKLFPKSVIDKVMDQQINEIDGIAGLDETGTDGFEEKEPAPIPMSPAKPIDILGQASLRVGEDDGHGGIVLVNDIDQGIVISKITTMTYTARLVQIDDPERVFIGTTDRKGSQGKLICDYLKDENAIVGVNASGFLDYNGVGMGGDIIGKTISRGEAWGDYFSPLYTMGFTEDNTFIAGEITDWDSYHLRDAMQSKPVIIKDGKSLMKGSSGWGLQPRTIIAQRDDGVAMFLVVDGRKPGYSLGATMEQCADILLEYGAVTAAACDGGSSSVLAYNGEIINDPSTPMETGRYLPNAFLVARKEAQPFG